MNREEIYAKYIGVRNINAILKQRNVALVAALEAALALCNDTISYGFIDWAEVGPTKEKIEQALAKVGD